MKLAFCLFRYYPFGGLERDFLRIVMKAQQENHTITIYTMSWEGEIPPGLDLVMVAAKGYSNHARCLSFARQLQRHLQKESYDLVVGFNRMPGLDVYYAADICYVAQARSKYGWWRHFLPRYHAYAALEQAVFNPQAATKILLLAAAEQAHYKKYYGTAPQRFYLLPPGVAPNQTSPAQRHQIRTQLRQELHLRPEQQIVLMVGSDFKRKGVDRAIKAIAALSSAQRAQTLLVVIGAGKPKPLLALAKTLGIEQQILFMGARHDVARFMLSADLLLHPAYQETAGLVLLEALVAELPVLVTENCGYAFHIAQAQAGIVVSRTDVQVELNAALAKMLDTEQQATWRTNARAYAVATDLYSLPQRVLDLLVEFQQEKNYLTISG